MLISFDYFTKIRGESTISCNRGKIYRLMSLICVMFFVSSSPAQASAFCWSWVSPVICLLLFRALYAMFSVFFGWFCFRLATFDVPFCSWFCDATLFPSLCSYTKTYFSSKPTTRVLRFLPFWWQDFLFQIRTFYAGSYILAALGSNRFHVANHSASGQHKSIHYSKTSSQDRFLYHPWTRLHRYHHLAICKYHSRCVYHICTSLRTVLHSILSIYRCLTSIPL